MEKSYDVFISFKNTTETGDYTEDSRIARELYDAFKSSGLNPFYSEESLGAMGSSDYTNDIENALKNSKTMVVVLTKVKHAESRWVAKEWQLFDSFYLNNIREGKNLYTLTKKVDVTQLPPTLATVENFDYANGLDPVVKAIHAVAEKPILKRYRRMQLKLKLKPILTAIGLVLIFALGVLAGHFGTRFYDRFFNIGDKVYPGDNSQGSSIHGVQNNAQSGSQNGTQNDVGSNQDTQGTENTQGNSNDPNAAPGSTTTNPPGNLTVSDSNDTTSSSAEGTTRETAFSIALDTTYSATINTENDTLWCKFTTGADQAVHRLILSPQIAAEDIDRSRSTHIDMAIYDSVGIMLSHKEVYYFRGETGFIDLYLEPNKDYHIKCNLKNFTDNASLPFSLQVEEKPCDVGTTVETATKLTFGQRYEATLDSTLPEYFVFLPEESASYKITLHNINTGTYIRLAHGKKDDILSKYESTYNLSVENENNDYTTAWLNKNIPYYFRINTDKLETNGKYIIVVEKN